MPLAPLSPAAFAFIAQVEEAFATLLRSVVPGETALGGRLLYAGEMDEAGRACSVAANLAGAATLAASADPAVGKQAMRDGIVDFLVHSLDEALRVLKNQVRKHETVAVCVSAAPVSIEAEMRARGVVPDLSFAENFTGARAHWPGERSHSVTFKPRTPAQEGPAEEEKTWLTWRVAEAPALWLPKLDALALNALSPDNGLGRGWIERAPRYLGRFAQNARPLRVTQREAGEILARFGAAGIGVPIEITFGPWGDADPPSPVAVP